MKQSTEPSFTCVIGVGNPIRNDDALGTFVCEALEKLALPRVRFLVVHQLDPAMIEDLLSFEKIVIVDAAVEGDDVAFAPLEKVESNAVASSHHVNAAMLQALALKVYNRNIQFFLCAVRGENFELGQALSQTAQKNAGEAIKLLTSWLQSSMG
jgi:hydrogenase maturation protease